MSAVFIRDDTLEFPVIVLAQRRTGWLWRQDRDCAGCSLNIASTAERYYVRFTYPKNEHFWYHVDCFENVYG